MKKILSLILSTLIIMSVFVCVPVSAVEAVGLTVREFSDGISGELVSRAGKLTYKPELNLRSVSNGVELVWDYPGEADSYEIYRRKQGEKNAACICRVTKESYVDTKVQNGVYYLYYVKAVKTGVETVPSESILTCYLAAPAKVKVSNGLKGVDISWTEAAGTEKLNVTYNVYARANGETEYTLLKSGIKKGAGYTHTTAKTGRYYRYDVVAVLNNTHYGVRNTNGPLIKFVQTPALVSVKNMANGVQFTWKTVSGADGYRVYRRAGGEKNYTYLATVTNASYRDKAVKSGTYYKYVVKAVHGKTYSGFDSNGKVIKYLAAPKLNAIANGTDGVYIRWSKVSGADSYVIYRRGAGEKYQKLTTVKASAEAKYKDTTAVACQHYRYTVMAASKGYYSGYNSDGLYIKFMPMNGTWNKSVTYNFYNYAVDKVKNRGAAGYDLSVSQVLNGVDVKSKYGDQEDAKLESAMKSSFNSSNKKVVYNKGTSDAMDYFPCDFVKYNQVKKATCTKKGNNYQVTLVFVDTKDPLIGGDNAVSLSNVTTIDKNVAAKQLCSDGTFTKADISTLYKAYTITAEITPEGKFVKMTHNAPVTVNMKLVSPELGNINVNMDLTQHVLYGSFRY